MNRTNSRHGIRFIDYSEYFNEIKKNCLINKKENFIWMMVKCTFKQVTKVNNATKSHHFQSSQFYKVITTMGKVAFFSYSLALEAVWIQYNNSFDKIGIRLSDSNRIETYWKFIFHLFAEENNKREEKKLFIHPSESFEKSFKNCSCFLFCCCQCVLIIIMFHRIYNQTRLSFTRISTIVEGIFIFLSPILCFMNRWYAAICIRS